MAESAYVSAQGDGILTLNDTEEIEVPLQEGEHVGKGLHHRIYPYMDHLVQYATDRGSNQEPWIVRDRSAALRAERRGEGKALVRTWVPTAWAYVNEEEDYE